jgi:hypothetical protein
MGFKKGHIGYKRNGNRNPFYGKHHTETTKIKISKARLGIVPWNKGIPRTDEEKKRISKSSIGKHIPEILGNKNPAKRPEVRKRMSLSHKGQLAWNKGLNVETDERVKKYGDAHKGEKGYQWRGGKRLARMRRITKRRQLGSEFLNKPFTDSEGHHINRNQIVFIPKEMHKSMPHRLNDMDTMIDINEKVYDWMLFEEPRCDKI